MGDSCWKSPVDIHSVSVKCYLDGISIRLEKVKKHKYLSRNLYIEHFILIYMRLVQTTEYFIPLFGRKTVQAVNDTIAHFFLWYTFSVTTAKGKAITAI